MSGLAMEESSGKYMSTMKKLMQIPAIASWKSWPTAKLLLCDTCVVLGVNLAHPWMVIMGSSQILNVGALRFLSGYRLCDQEVQPKSYRTSFTASCVAFHMRSVSCSLWFLRPASVCFEAGSVLLHLWKHHHLLSISEQRLTGHCQNVSAG